MNKVSGVISSNQELEISGASSHDPAGYDITYKWTCNFDDGTECTRPSGSKLRLGTESFMVISQSDIKDYVNYIIKLEINSADPHR